MQDYVSKKSIKNVRNQELSLAAYRPYLHLGVLTYLCTVCFVVLSFTPVCLLRSAQ